MLIILICLLIFVLWLRYQISKSKNISHSSSESFWDKEYKSNFVRKRDLSQLDYLLISEEDLPFVITEDEEILKLQDSVRILSQKKLLNLSDKSNTDIKLTYGTANLTLLSEYDENFSSFLKILYKWANLLYSKNYISEAQKALELGIRIKTDISGNYILLAKIYKNNSNYAAIDNLINKAEELNTLMKDSIINALVNIRNS